MLRSRGVTSALGVCLALLLSSAPASAGDNDLVLSRLGNSVRGDTDVVGNNQAFRSLVSELGVVLAPRLLAPADTLGFGGFQFTVDVGWTGISNNEDFWRVLEGSPDPSGTGVVHGNGLMNTVGIFMRKGIWFPLPSFEVGAGVVHLSDSSIWAAQGYAKFALHEGYHKWPLPSVAVRGSGSRMMGSKDLDLTIGSLDISISKHLGIAGTMRLEPYLGWNLLVIVPRSEVVDKTPQVADDSNMNFVYKDQDNILRHRLFGGVKVQYYVFEITLEASVALSGGSVDDRSGDTNCSDVTDPTMLASCDAVDQAGTQESFIMSVGLDF